MEITWLGYSCFRLKGKNSTVITDPFPPGLGYDLGKTSGDIVTISHMHPEHSYFTAVAGEPKKISSPGEYEIGGVLIIGVPSFHDAEKGAIFGKNNIFAIEIDDVAVCHLGDLGHPLSSSQIEEIGNVDVLLVPVGGGSTINAAQAAGVIRSIEPKIVIPMHYKTPELTREMNTVDKFLKEMGIAEASPQPKLNVSKSNLPPSTQVAVLSI
jgi:L-ascorbate metabolism protein UlaG (beta-lactamase superfamily)